MKACTFTAVAVLAGTVAAQNLYSNLSSLNHTCVIQPRLRSCPAANTTTTDVCCAETFGGLILQTQFWSTYTGLESQGQKLPRDKWTIHGLWPDFCNGSYTQYCDLRRQYDPSPSPNTTNGLPNGTVVPAYNGTPISQFIKDFGRYDLLDYMTKNWINQNEANEVLWAHEFSKHATCFSTFQIPCYGPQYRRNEDVINYFDTVVLFYERYPTWQWLAKASIVPSNRTQVSLADIQGNLTRASGSIPYIGCSGPRYNTTTAGRGSNDTGRTVLSEVWYFSHVYGRPQDGYSVPVNATGSSTSSCARTSGALWYYEQTPSSLQK